MRFLVERLDWSAVGLGLVLIAGGLMLSGCSCGGGANNETALGLCQLGGRF